MPRNSPSGHAALTALLKLNGKRCTVVGGGRVAARKIRKLLAAGANVRVISPDICAPIQDWVDTGAVEWVQRAFEPGDTADAWLIFAATNNRAVNQQVWEEGERSGRFVNVCDDPSLCTLTMPAVAQRGRLQVAISTGGTRPSWARQLRERLERDWEEGIDTFSSAARAFADEAD